MRSQSDGFSFVELMMIVVVISIIAVFSIPSLSRTVTVYRNRASAEALAQQLYQARQAAITFGRRSTPLRVYLYPATNSLGVGVWFDRNNTGLDPTLQSPPSQEIIRLPQGITVGSDLAAATQCNMTNSTPLAVVEYNSRGELPVDYTISPCLATGPSNVNIYVEAIKKTVVVSRCVVGISLSGSVSVASY
jgi:Tfp pilus assembly protein FimT